jgi:hypothetical protein
LQGRKYCSVGAVLTSYGFATLLFVIHMYSILYTYTVYNTRTRHLSRKRPVSFMGKGPQKLNFLTVFPPEQKKQ